MAEKVKDQASPDAGGVHNGDGDGLSSPAAGSRVMAHKDDDLAINEDYHDPNLGGLSDSEDPNALGADEQHASLGVIDPALDPLDDDVQGEDSRACSHAASVSPSLEASPELEEDQGANDNVNVNSGDYAPDSQSPSDPDVYDPNDDNDDKNDENAGDVDNSGSNPRGKYKRKDRFVIDAVRGGYYFRGQPEYALHPGKTSRQYVQYIYNRLLPISTRMHTRSIDKTTFRKEVAAFDCENITNTRDVKGYWFNVLLHIIQIYRSEYYNLYPQHFDARKRILPQYVMKVNDFDDTKSSTLKTEYYSHVPPSFVFDPRPYVESKLRKAALKSMGGKHTGSGTRATRGVRTMNPNVVDPISGDSGDANDSDFAEPLKKRRRVSNDKVTDKGKRGTGGATRPTRRTRVSRAPSYDKEEIDIRSSEDSGELLIDRRTGDRIRVSIGNYSKHGGQTTTAPKAHKPHNTSRQKTRTPSQVGGGHGQSKTKSKNTQQRRKKSNNYNPKNRNNNPIGSVNTRIPKKGEKQVISRVNRTQYHRGTTTTNNSRSQSRSHSRSHSNSTTREFTTRTRRKTTPTQPNVRLGRPTVDQDDNVPYISHGLDSGLGSQYQDDGADGDVENGGGPGDSGIGGGIRNTGRRGGIRHRRRDATNDAIAEDMAQDEQRPRGERRYRSRTTEDNPPDSPPTFENWNDHVDPYDDDWQSDPVGQQSDHGANTPAPPEWDEARKREEMLLYLDNISLFGRSTAIDRLRKIIKDRTTANLANFPKNIPLEWARKYLPELQLIDGSSRTSYIGGVMFLAMRGSDREIAVKNKIALSMSLPNITTIENHIGEFKFDVPFIELFALVAILIKQIKDRASIDDIQNSESLKLAIDALESLKLLLLEFVACGANSEPNFRPFILQLIDDIVNPQLLSSPCKLLNSRPTLKLAARDRARRPNQKKTKNAKLTPQICKDFLLGSCSLGHNCTKPHMCLVCPHGTAHSLATCKKFLMKNHLFTKSYVDQRKAELAALKATTEAVSEKTATKTKSKK